MHVVKAWAGHSSTDTTDQYYLSVSEGDYAAAAAKRFSEGTQLCAQLGESGTEEEKPESVSPGFPSTSIEAGERIRTADVQLGKLTRCVLSLCRDNWLRRGVPLGDQLGASRSRGRAFWHSCSF